MDYRINLFTPYAGTVGMLIRINEKFTMGKLKLSPLSKSFVLNRPHCQFRRQNKVGKSKQQVQHMLW